MTRAPLQLLLCTTLALVPVAARAGDPNDPLFGAAGDPCFAISDVSKAAVFGDPNDPDGGFYTHLPDCANVCKKAGLSCAKFAKRAGACVQRSADDRARFKRKTNCDASRSADPKQCAADVEVARAQERQSAADAVAAEVTACTARATDCAGKCDATP